MKWQADDPNVQEKVGNGQTEQGWIWYVTILQLSKNTRPERREMRATLQSIQNQECHDPESHDNEGDESENVEIGPAVLDTKDAAEEEQSAYLDATQGGYWKEVKSNIQL